MESIKEIDIIITVIVGTVVMFMMTAVIVFSVLKYQKNVLKQKETLRNVEKKYQMDLLDASIRATEREVVAKNMHDDVGTLINVIKLNNNKLKNNVQNESIVLEVVNTNNQLLLEINENVKSISNDLMSPTLSKLGFMKALDQLCTQINNSNSVKVIIDSKELEKRFDSKIEIQLFRICKEILNNILKHSNSTEISLNLNFVQNLFTILISYNGKGINDEDVKLMMENNKGLGLKSIYGRIQILGASINYITQKEERATAIIRIPIINKI